ncbi:MAG TPA: hypothetical protein VGC72_07350 [Candidatus Elarobacter sp.]
MYLLKVFAEQYGVLCRFGGRTGRFHYRERTIFASELPPPGPPFEMFPPPNTNISFIARYMTRTVKPGIQEVEVAFLFALNRAAYRSDLTTQSFDKVVRRSISRDVPPEPDFSVDQSSVPSALERLMMHLKQQVTERQFYRLISSVPNHPIVRRYEVLARLKRTLHSRGSIPTKQDVATFGSIAIDANTWAQTALQPPLWNFVPDPAVQARLRTTTLNAEAYEDTISELYVWAALRERGITSTLREDPGLSDLDMYLPGGIQVPGEVKCIRDTTNLRNIRNHFKKASAQLRRSPGFPSGILFLRILAESVPLIWAEPLPRQVQQCRSEIRALLGRERYSGIAACILIWEDLKNTTVRGTSVIVMHRHSELIVRSEGDLISRHMNALAIGEAFVFSVNPVYGLLL